ncbi:MAG: PAS domain S-box protein [Balneolaceae bacterium]|nr:PAS domain S-box protein [Balneolaceae bacterium]
MHGKFENLRKILDKNDCQLLLDHIPRLLILADLEGEILFWNRGGQEVMGYSMEQAEGMKVWFMYPDRGESDFLCELDRLKEGEIITQTMRARHEDGSERWLNIKKRLIELNNGKHLVMETGSDITNTVQTKKVNARNERRLKAILDTAVEGIITIDKHGVIESFNNAAEEIFGYEAEEVIGKNIRILMPSPYYEEHDEYMRHYLETGERKIIGQGREVRGKRKSGEIFPMELSVSEVKINGTVFFTGIISDISERRKLENEILQISEEERHKIGRELHDGLGQMLTGIGLIARNLANKLKSNELPGAQEVQEIADMIREADEQARSLAHGLVHLELEEEGFHVALEQLCKRAKRLFNIECDKDLDSDFQIDDKMAILHLYRIVQEAISNAVKHGQATVVKVELNVSDDLLQLKVIDNGIGFTNPGNREKLKGIGLNTMSYRAHILGGYLDMRESPEGHTVLDCRIPIKEFNYFKNNHS